jgi:hypothetical protein
MIRRFGFYLVAVIGFACCPGMADVAAVLPDPGISDQIKSDLNVRSHPDEIAEINHKVHDEVTKLAQNPADAAVVSAARQWLIGEMLLQGNVGGTAPGYQEAYSGALNQEFSDLLSRPTTAVNTRLNIGIIVAQLQGKTESLAPTVVLLLNDKSSAVVLWGENAAGAILPVAMQNASFKAEPVLAAVVDAVISHPDGAVAGMIADEAYRAINPKLWPPGLFPPQPALNALIAVNLKLQKSRLELYKKGIPASPWSDSYASYLLLGFNNIWNSMNATQRQDAAQQASDLVWLAGRRAANQASNQNDELIRVLKEEGEWIAALGVTLDDQGLQKAGAAVNQLGVASPANVILDACKTVYPAMQAQFPNMPPPPSFDTTKSASDSSIPAPASEAQR